MAGAQLDHTGACTIDAGSGDGPGSFACGSITCGPTQICVNPCCGGARLCEPLPDGGVCLGGACTLPGGAAGCYSTCTPPPAYCVDVPASCGATPTCGCLTSGTCCTQINGRQALCLCA
jgi:hypothetical protein